MAKELLSYIAGFLDGDGCIMLQLVRRKDYVYGFQIRASIVFYQKQKHRVFLEWLQKQFQVGYIRNRNDGMSEYTIVGFKSVTKVLKKLKPFLRLKKKHVNLVFKVDKIFSKGFSVDKLLKASKYVDEFLDINYSKKRTNTSKELEQFLKNQKLISP